MPNVEPKNAGERTVLEFFAAVVNFDHRAYERLFIEDLSWTTMVKELPGAGRHDGREHVIAVLLSPLKDLFVPGGLQVHVNSFVSEGNLVMCETRTIGRRTDGREYDNLYAWAFEMHDEKIAHIREYTDSLYVARFMGLNLSIEPSEEKT